MFLKFAWKMAVGATAIALLAAGCSSGGSEDSDSSGNSIIVGIAEPQHLIPTNTTETSGAQVLAALFYPLVDFDDKNNPELVAAESITSDDNKVWTVKLKPGFTFSNGEAVTADSYINAWNYGAYGPNAQGASYFFERIEGYADLNPKDPDKDGPLKAPEPKAKTLTGLKKVDDTTFTVTLSAPFVGWESVMGYTAFLPLPNAAFSAPGVIADGFEDAIIGNGPFKMKGTWQHDSQIEVEKVDGFKGTVPKINGVNFKIYQDQKAEYADLVAGNNDVQTTIPIESLAAAPGDLGDRFQKSPSSSFQFVGFPTFQKEFSNVNIRKALSMAINRQEMTDQIFLGSQTPAKSFVSPAVAGYREDSCKASCEYNPTEAKKLWDANNGPKKIQITYNADGGHKAWVDAMCNQIKQSLPGTDCVGTGEPKFADLLTKVDKQEPVGLIRLGWVMDYPLMENYLGPLFSGDPKGSSNHYGYNNPTFDALLKEGSAAKTLDEANIKWQAAEDIIAQDMPVIPLRFGQNVYGFSEKVKNVKVDTQTRVDLYTIETSD